MNTPNDIVIVGGGPVGLFLGLCLHKHNIDFVILEQRTEPVPDSRSLGVHPPSLELFEKLDILQSFLDAGLKIRRGLAHNGNKVLGSIDFSDTGPFPYILACPQSQTESILREEVQQRVPGSLRTASTVTSITPTDEGVVVRYRNQGQETEISASYVIGCDGKDSFVREAAGIPLVGKPYPDTYIMGDFTDTTSFGEDAVVFLPKDGMVECFPLPNGKRRWVVKTPTYIRRPTDQLLAGYVKERTPFELDALNSEMLSSFGVQHYIAESFHQNRILLCGDAAHVVSPIGGQGMNLGWIGAYELSHTLREILYHQAEPGRELSEYERRHKKRARKAARRAEMNMFLGRKHRFTFLKRLLIYLLLNSPLRSKAARSFTMRDLDKGGL